MKIGDELIEQKKITGEQLKIALQIQKNSSSTKKLGEILVEEGFCTEGDVTNALCKMHNLEYVDIEEIFIPETLMTLISEKILRKYCAIPIQYVDESTLKVVMEDPLNFFALSDLGQSSGYKIKAAICEKQKIIETLNRHLSINNNESAIDSIKKEELATVDTINVVDNILERAFSLKASDIHFEPEEKILRVRCRIDGDLQEIYRCSIDSYSQIVNRLKILAVLKTEERRLPQDGKIQHKFGKNKVDLRISTLPTVNGEKAVLRILNTASVPLAFDCLGLSKEEISEIKKMIQKPYGIILVTGPTGSGKTTTLYTILNYLKSSKLNIVTVEDPAEFNIEGITQVPVNSEIRFTFATALRSILRQDPDIIMVGEIRDSETAEIAVRAALTGHLVISTLHTNTSVAAITRLLDMGIPRYLVADTLIGCISQRLVKRLCCICSEEYEVNEEEIELLKVPPGTVLKKESDIGCEKCNTGSKGRIGIYEILNVDRDIKEAIRRNVSFNDIEKLAVKKGMKLLSESCRKKVIKGITSLEQYKRAIFSDL